MERYLVITTTTDKPTANRACEMLEETGIPFLMEFVDVASEDKGNQDTSTPGYKLLVPSQFHQRATILVGRASGAGSRFINN